MNTRDADPLILKQSWRRTGLCFGFELLLCLGFSLAGLSSLKAAPPGTAAERLPGDRDAFVVFGKITDPAGNSVGGVQVVANCGHGTLMPTGSCQSGTNGQYRLTFGPGVLFGRAIGAGASGVGFQAATIHARKKGFYTRNLGRSGDLAMTDSTNAPPEWIRRMAGVVRAHEPYRLDFIMEAAASVRGKLIGGAEKLPAKANLCLIGDKLPPSSSALACAQFNDLGEFEFSDVPVGYDWWFELTWREEAEGSKWRTLRSKPLAFHSPEAVLIQITLEPGMLDVRRR